MKRQSSYGIGSWIGCGCICIFALIFLVADSIYEWNQDRRADALFELTIWPVLLVFTAIVCFLWARLAIQWRKRDKLEALSVAGKKCDFCGGGAVSRGDDGSGSIYSCYDCKLDLSRIFAKLAAAEQPDLMQPGQSKEASVLFALRNPRFQLCLERVSQQAVEVLKERKRDGDGKSGT